jgi:hypothetical protein
MVTTLICKSETCPNNTPWNIQSLINTLSTHRQHLMEHGGASKSMGAAELKMFPLWIQKKTITQENPYVDSPTPTWRGE